jgi:hypothetical protein
MSKNNAKLQTYLSDYQFIATQKLREYVRVV